MNRINDNLRIVRAIRQVLLEKDCAQIVFEPAHWNHTCDIPKMCHYDGHIVPVYTVTMPEAVPEDQRPGDWTPERIAKSIVLCCEHNGLIHSELLDGSESVDGTCIDWTDLLICVYDELADPEKDPDWPIWFADFEAALNAGVPAEARALRARLMNAGYSEVKPCDLGAVHALRDCSWSPTKRYEHVYEFETIRPCGDTVAVTDISDGHEIEIRNTSDPDGYGSESDSTTLLAVHTNDNSIRSELLRENALSPADLKALQAGILLARARKQ